MNLSDDSQDWLASLILRPYSPKTTGRNVDMRAYVLDESSEGKLNGVCLINAEKFRFYFPTCGNRSRMNYFHSDARFGTTIST